MTSDTTSDAGPDAASAPTAAQRFRALSLPARVATYVGVVVLSMVLVSLTTAYVVVHRPLPQTSGSLDLEGLESTVRVVRDDAGIPQIYADTADDLMLAQGFVHAQDRFFEMDVRRHATAGRLAEIFGADAVESDSYVRTMGWRRVAERELPLLDPETRAALDAYSAGVNAYLADRSAGEISLEYTLLNVGGLDYLPELWTPVDSLAWLKAMAWDLRGNMGDEIDRALTLAAVGDTRTDVLYPGYDYDLNRTIVDQGVVVDGVFEQDATTGGTRNPQRPPFGIDSSKPVEALTRVRAGLDRLPAWLGRGEGLGSNSWVIDGERSATGEPILANDPHLGIGLPGVWTQVGLHCTEVTTQCPYDVAGFSFSGVPGVIIGHNADIAWGFTNLGPDVTDLYVEQVSGDSALYDGRDVPLRTRTETIEVAGGDDVELTVRSTRHGPLISDVNDLTSEIAEISPQVLAQTDPRADLTSDASTEYAIALEWTALQPGTTADAILALNRASDWDEFRAAAADFAVPAQNLVYADKEGHIGYQAPGQIPIRQSGNDGRLPSPGWLPENDWTGEFVPYDALPSVLDPDEGFVVTANQAVIGRDYDYFLTDDWDRGYRAQRIRDLLVDQDTLSVADLADLQLDDLNPLAPTLTPYLRDQDLPRGYASAGQKLLADWDYTQPAEGPNSAAAAYFNVVWSEILARTFHDELPEEVWPTGGSRWFAVIADLLRDPDADWWDDLSTESVTEDRDDILTAALIAARDELTVQQSPTADEWTWGGLHELDLRSATLGESGIGIIEGLFNRGPWDIAGSSSTVNATGWDATEGYAVTTSPSMRMVVSMADLDDSRWINLTGVSGHAFSDNYTDQTDLWARGETLPWAFSSNAVDAAGDDTLMLNPAGSTS
ncbi:penicillin acylase family protein [Nocardioides salsibiostraticola]